MNKQELIETIAEKRELNLEAVGKDLSFAYEEFLRRSSKQ